MDIFVVISVFLARLAWCCYFYVYIFIFYILTCYGVHFVQQEHALPCRPGRFPLGGCGIKTPPRARELKKVCREDVSVTSGRIDKEGIKNRQGEYDNLHKTVQCEIIRKDMGWAFGPLTKLSMHSNVGHRKDKREQEQ